MVKDANDRARSHRFLCVKRVRFYLKHGVGKDNTTPVCFSFWAKYIFDIGQRTPDIVTQ